MAHAHKHPAADALESHAAHAMSAQPVGNESHAGHGATHTDHTGHERMFRTRFWVCLVLSIPVLVFSPALQRWLGFRAPTFPNSEWIPYPILAGHLRLRRRALSADGYPGTAQS